MAVNISPRNRLVIGAAQFDAMAGERLLIIAWFLVNFAG